MTSFVLRDLPAEDANNQSKEGNSTLLRTSG